MSYPINQRINPSKQPQAGINSTANMQGIDPGAAIQEGINDSPITKATENPNYGLVAALTVPTYFGIMHLMNRFNHACATRLDGAPNILDKVRNFGDRIANSSAFDSKAFTGLTKFFKGTRKFIENKIISRSRILTAFFKTPSLPVNSSVIMQAKGTSAELAGSAAQFLEKYTDGGTNLQKIMELGFTKTRKVSRGWFLPRRKVVEADLDAFNKMIKNPTDNIRQIADLCRKQGVGSFMDVSKAGKIPGWMRKIFGGKMYFSDVFPFANKLITKKIYFSEFSNRLDVFLKDPKSKTTLLGRLLPKAMLRTIEGLTFGMAGGPLGVIMQSYFIADATVKSAKAPKGEKTKTFMENMIYQLSWYITMPFGIKLMHKFGGLKNIGVAKANVDKYREHLKDFNDKINSGAIKDKAVYKAERQKLDAIKKQLLTSEISIKKGDKFMTIVGKSFRNILYKPLVWASRVLTIGLETPAAFNPNGIGKNSGIGEKIGQFFKNGKWKGVKGFGGGALRFGIFMFVISPFLAKWGAKLSHVIFGKPTHSVLDDDEPQKEEKTQPVVQTKAPVAVPEAATTETTEQAPQAQLYTPTTQVPSSFSRIAFTQNPQQQQPQVASKLPPDPVVPSRDMSMVMPQEGPARTYIPSSEGAKFKPDKDSSDPQIQAILNKANAATKSANRFIKKPY